MKLTSDLKICASILALSSLAACGGGGGSSAAGGGGTAGGSTAGGVTTIIDTTVTVVTTAGGASAGGATAGGATAGGASAGGSSYSGCDDSGCNAFTNGGSKDTNYQKAQAEQKSVQSEAESLASRFDMGFNSAYQVATLANQVKAMSVQGQLTAKDQAAISQSAFAIGGVTTDEVNNAVKANISGDKSQAEDLMDRAAEKMGMSSGADFRDKVLPAVGIKY